MKKPSEIKPAQGKLGVLLPGFGAVATTFVAGVEAAGFEWEAAAGAPSGRVPEDEPR